jgi:hypothetical protein
MVLHMSAQSMHMDAHLAMSPDIIALSEQIVHACSHAAHASMSSFIAIMSMPGMVIESIILEVMFIKRESPSVIHVADKFSGGREPLHDEMLRQSCGHG